MNQRWPDGLFERVEAAAASMDGCSVTDLTVLALERTIAEMPGASRSVPSSEAAKSEPARSVVTAPSGICAPDHDDVVRLIKGERCPHPKARRSRGQCMACFAYL